jgi:hypothetical protein
MRRRLIAGLFVGAVLVAGPAVADVRISVANGLVSVSATDATVRQILTEWARVGQTRIVNVERVGGAPITIELVNVPEAQALDVILRSVSGYVAAPRAATVPNASLYDRILLLPTSTPVAAPAAPAARTPNRPGTAPPVFQPPPFQPPPPVADDQQIDDDEPRQGVPQPGAPGRPPVITSFQPPPQQREAPDQQPPPPTSYPAPTSPVGVAVPGMPVPVPQQPGQAQPGQPRR